MKGPSYVDKKQTFPELYIKNIASDDRVYQQGKAIAKQDGSVSVPYVDENNTVHFTIKGDTSKGYHPSISFYQNGVAKGYHCDCGVFEKSSGACKHVVSAMISLNKYEASDIPNDKKVAKAQPKQSFNHHFNNVKAVDEIIANYRKKHQFKMSAVTKETVTMSFDLAIKGPERVTTYVMTMNVGIDHLYVVKDIEAVIEDLLEGNTIEFGKRFTYDPENYRVELQDRKMLQLLNEISQVVQSASFSNSYGDKKELLIPPQFAKDVIRQLMQVDNGFLNYESPNSSRGENPTNTTIEEETTHLPLQFYIEETENSEINFRPAKSTINALRMFPNANMVLIDDTFYFLTNDQYQSIYYLKEAFELVQKGPIIFSQNEFTDFASEVLPQLRGFVDITMDDEVESMLIAPEVSETLYIDWQQDTLYVRPIFRYQNATFSPFVELEDAEETSSDQLIVRDLNKESTALETLADASNGFKQEEDMLVTDNLNNITHFLYERLGDLANVFEIYLTNSAQNILYQPERAPRINIDYNESSNLLDVDFDMEDISPDDISNLVKILRTNESNYYRLTNGKIVDLKNRAFQEMQTSINKLAIDEDDINDDSRTSIPLYQGLSVIDDESINKGKDFEELIKDLKEPSELEFSVPESLEADLRSYQVEGYSWLRALDYYGLGGVLADDMGLGKTIQAITYIASAVEDDQAPFLIICPSSVMFNWKKEFEKFAPSIPTTVIQGSQEDRRIKIAEARENNVPVLITSYPLIQRDKELYDDITFKSLILDEAQNVKNASAKTTQKVRALNREKVFALSGTPIENNLSELYSLFSIVLPGLFGSAKEFKNMSTSFIADKIRPFILRRLKSEVLHDLPEKTETTEYIDLSDDQKRLYQAQISMLRDNVQEFIENDTLGKNQMNILSGMMRLRQICNDPRLINEEYNGESSKLERLMEVLDEAHENGRRIVLFSQFTKMLDIIKKEVNKRGYSYHYLSGSTPNEERLELTTRFNMGEKHLFLISLKAGGTGLNLTGGDTVILYDSWWNPAVEDQAADRVYRLGQKKAVQVIRLISQGTIEERISELQDKKRELVDSVIESDNKEASSLTKNDILNILEM